MNFLEHVILARHTTLGVGGPARYFAEARSEDDVREALAFAAERALPIFVLGGGSNLVVSDSGFAGLVLKISILGLHEYTDGNRQRFELGGGEDWDRFVAHAVEQHCAGVECLSGIPGSVGGTPVQNVGAYGQEVSDTIVNVSAIDTCTGEVHAFTNEECEFRYRESRFNTVDRGRWVIVGVTFALRPGGEPLIAYRDLQRYFEEATPKPTLSATRSAVLEIRKSKAMLLVEGDEDSRSAGSFFKNPIVTAEQFASLSERSGTEIPNYPAGDGRVKIPAAWLVEHSGFVKGTIRGAVGISRKHALAIVNRGGATAQEVLALKNEIEASVQQQFGIHLRSEPVFVGFNSKHPDATS